jgi:phosphohistidine phosphatase
MKLLTLIRHAKSSWKHPGLADIERPLNARGRRDAPAMGRRLAAVEPAPDLILASPAERAASPAGAIAAAIGIGADAVSLQRALYMATPKEMLRAIRGVDAHLLHLALVGHNPGITDLSEALADARFENVPTCGIVRLRLAIDTWPEACEGCGTLLDFDYPKREGR